MPWEVRSDTGMVWTYPTKAKAQAAAKKMGGSRAHMEVVKAGTHRYSNPRACANPKAMIRSTWQSAKVRRVNGRVQVKINPTMKDLKRAGAKLVRKVKRAVKRRKR